MANIKVFEEDINLQNLKNHGIKEGRLVSMILLEDSQFNVQTTTVPTYCSEDHEGHQLGGRKPGDKMYAGFVAEMDEKGISLLPGIDRKTVKNPEPGYIGGTRFDYNAIHSIAYYTRNYNQIEGLITQPSFF